MKATATGASRSRTSECGDGTKEGNGVRHLVSQVQRQPGVTGCRRLGQIALRETLIRYSKDKRKVPRLRRIAEKQAILLRSG